MGAPGVEQKAWGAGSLWTEEQDAFLREHWGKFSASDIAATKLINKSKNAVIGRAGRLKLKRLQSGSNLKSKFQGDTSSRRLGKPATVTPPSVAGPYSNPRKTLATWGRHADTGAGDASPLCPPAPVPFRPSWPVPWIDSTGCQFPVDVRGHVEPGQHMHMLVCDEPNIPGKRWCEHHFRAFFYKSDKRLRAVA